MPLLKKLPSLRTLKVLQVACFVVMIPAWCMTIMGFLAATDTPEWAVYHSDFEITAMSWWPWTLAMTLVALVVHLRAGRLKWKYHHTKVVGVRNIFAGDESYRLAVEFQNHIYGGDKVVWTEYVAPVEWRSYRQGISIPLRQPPANPWHQS